MSDDSSFPDKVKEIIKKFFSPGSKPTMETFPELVECMVWLRFVLAVSFGIWVSTQSDAKAGANILLALNFISFPPILYCKHILQADEDSFGSKLYFAGIVQALALTILIWVYFYTESHAREEAVFVSVFSKLLAAQQEDDVIAPDTGGATGIPEESEF